MNLSFKLAFRNIFRNRLRSLITLAVIALGSAAMIIAGGFIENTMRQVREACIRDSLGHLRIYKRGFLEDGIVHPYDYMITDVPDLLKKVKAVSHVAAAGPRLAYYGLIGNGDMTLPFIMQAYDPVLENSLRNTTTLVAGNFVEPGKPYDVMLGEGLVKTMGLRVGDSAVLLGNTQHGGMNAVDVNVGGVFRTIAEDYDSSGIRAPIQLAQNLLHVNGAQMLIVFLDDTAKTDSVKRLLSDDFKKEGLDYEIQTWSQMPEAREISAIESVYRRIYGVIKVVFFLFIILSIINTMNMAVLERIGEIGTLMALGTRRRGILKLFVTEGAILGVMGGFAGIFIGCWLALLISLVGIQMPSQPPSTVAWIARITVTPGTLAVAFAMALITSLISSILPAMKASRLEVAEALRHNV